MAGITDWADRLLDEAEALRARAGRLVEPRLRLGVTGLSGAGKTVFITALVASLLHRGRLHAFTAEREGRIERVELRPQPDPEVPRFAYETHLAALAGDPPRWPVSTRAVSQLRLTIRHHRPGFLGALTGTGVLHLDIVDYPGEWLLDLPLIDMDYESWAATALAAAESPARRAHAAGWQRALAAADPAAPFTDPAAEALAGAYAGYLGACRAAGLSALAPGRFLMPGDLEGSPLMTFAPLPRPDHARPDSLWSQMRERFEAYKRLVAKPFFRDHFARLDRQVVLVDALGALAGGPRALSDLTASMGETLAAFRHGRPSWLDRLVGAHRIDRMLVCASKADHLHHEQHGALTALVRAMLHRALSGAEMSGTEVEALSVAAIRTTLEQEITRDGQRLALVRGRRLDDGRESAVFPGTLPEDPEPLLEMASASDPGRAPEGWPEGEFAALRFRPPERPISGENGPRHIRMDRAIEFLIGDRLR